MTQDLRAAERAVVLWLDMDELARQALLQRGGRAHVTAAQWIALLYHGKSKSEENRLRAFERWKQRVRALPRTAWVPVEPDVESWSQEYHGLPAGALYAIDLKRLHAGLRRALDHRERLKEGWERYAGRPWVYASPGRRFRRLGEERESTVPEVAEALGIPKPTVYNWIRRFNLPHSRKGGKILLSLEEVEAWARTRERRGLRVATSPAVRERISAEVARPRLREIRDYLGLSNERLAELLGVTRAQVIRWTTQRWKRKAVSIPVAVMERAEELLDTELARTTRTTRAQRLDREVIEAALRDAGGNMTRAAVALDVPFQTFRKVMEDLGIGRAPRMPVKEARERLLAVRAALRLNDAYYAELLGTSHSNLKTWLGLGGQWRKLKTIPTEAVERAESLLEVMPPRVFQEASYQRMTREEVARAWEEGGRTIRGAAKALGVGPEGFRRLAESRGFELPVPLVGRITRRELEDLLERHQGVRASMARELGVTAPYVTMLLKKAGLYEGARSSVRASALSAQAVEQILRDAIARHETPHVAAKQAGLSRGSVLRKAADRHGLLGLYEEAKRLGRRRKQPNNPAPCSRCHRPRHDETPFCESCYHELAHGLQDLIEEEVQLGAPLEVAANPVNWSYYLSKLIGWTATGAVADVIMSRIQPYQEALEKGAQKAIVGGVSRAGQAARGVLKNPCPVCIGTVALGALGAWSTRQGKRR